MVDSGRDRLFCTRRSVRVGRPGLALVELSVVEQRYRAVLAVLAGATVTEVAASLGVSRQTVHGTCRPGADAAGVRPPDARQPRACPACHRHRVSTCL
ncbi:helix-turn-helix domain-containing protein [Streptomyces sp. NPDC005322]|uniref:helix-turn-helix domain-containing protein n=1 Tax=unclassified Streptomyces TaxID=2593676 RepID=UPI0033AF303F